MLFAGGLSDRGYNSMSSEDVRHIVAAVGSTDSAGVTPVNVCRSEDAGGSQGSYSYYVMQ